MRDGQPKGFSKEAQKRIERAMVARAQKQVAQLPQLPPELALQIANGIALAMQGKFSNIQVGLGSAEHTKHVRILIFHDEMQGAHLQRQPVLAVPGSAPVPPDGKVNTEPLSEEDLAARAKEEAKVQDDDGKKENDAEVQA